MFSPYVLVGFVHIAHIVGIIVHPLYEFSWRVDRKFARIGYVYLASLPLFGRYKDNTVGATVSIDGTRSSILQHRYRLYIVRVYIRKAHLHTVYHDEWARVVQRSHTTNVDTHALGVRATRALHHLNACCHACQGLCCCGYRARKSLFLEVHRGHRPRKIHLLLGTITHYYHLVEVVTFGHHGHVQVTRSVQCLRLKAHTRQGNLTVVAFQSELKPTLCIGNTAIGGTLFYDVHAYERLTQVVDNPTCYNFVLLSYGHCAIAHVLQTGITGKSRRHA